MPAVVPIPRISLKNILVTTDFSPASTSALPFALALARLYEAKLIVAHVLAPEPHTQVVTDRVPAEDNWQFEQVRRKLSVFAPQQSDVKCDQLIERGDLAQVIPQIIREKEIDLVVLGTHGRRGFKKLILGSDAEKIYRHATCPVLTIGPNVPSPEEGKWKIKRILFPVDLESNTVQALSYTLSLAEENEADLILVHAAPLVPWQHQLATEKRVREDILSLISPEAKNWCKPEVVVRWNYPSEAILGVATERDIDLIAMGVNKRSTSHWPWPIASEVVGLAPCPVLTVRT